MEHTQECAAPRQASADDNIDLLIIKNIGTLLTPNHAPPVDIIIGGGQVIGLSSHTAALQCLPGVCVLDAAGHTVCPGFVDNHVHVTGGGGEAGPESRCPEAKLSQLIDAGITTVVGLLGTDSVTRSQEALVSKTAALNADGLTAYHWVGGYKVPVRTVTGDIQKELVAISSCIGVGEIAVGDHRSSAPTPQELARIAMEARVGGMLSGKAGLMCCHMGTAPNRMQLLHDAVALGVPITQLLLTHMERASIGQDGAIDADDWLRIGGSCDFTAGPTAVEALVGLEQRGHDLSRCTVSSDAFGSYPEYDAQGRLVKYKMSLPTTLLTLVCTLHHKHSWPLEKCLSLLSRNPANVLSLLSKGHFKVGCDADLLILNKSTLDLQYVIAQGRIVRTPDWTLGNMMENGERIRQFAKNVPNRERLHTQ